MISSSYQRSSISIEYHISILPLFPFLNSFSSNDPFVSGHFNDFSSLISSSYYIHQSVYRNTQGFSHLFFSNSSSSTLISSQKCDDSVFSICDSSSTHHACKSNKSNKRVVSTHLDQFFFLTSNSLKEFVNIDEFIMYLCDGEKLIYSPEDNRFDTLQVIELHIRRRL